jgi:hypothetical protein
VVSTPTHMVWEPKLKDVCDLGVISLRGLLGIISPVG